MVYAYGWAIVRKWTANNGSRGDFELKLDELFHLSYQSHGEDDWRCALMHRDHHVGAWFAFENGTWTMTWNNVEDRNYIGGDSWETKGICHPFDIVEFLNTNEDAALALKTFQRDTLEGYCGFVKRHIRSLNRELKVKLPKKLKEARKNLANLNKMLKAL